MIDIDQYFNAVPLTRKYDINLVDIIIPKKTHIYTRNNQPIEFDKQTMVYYKSIRQSKLDPIFNKQMDDQTAFVFKDEWDPYTGERLGLDPIGPLYFDPDYLIFHFYKKRLDNLWIKPVDENDGYYDGHYGDAVGASEDFYIASRGHHPEWYLFRLPIIDCYLTKDHNLQHVTFGPKLTTEELKEIDRLSDLSNTYKQTFKHNKPSLLKMEELYKIAISKEVSDEENRKAVDALRKMK